MQKYTRSLRNYRVYHKILGLTLSILLTISALTGIFLAWKKNVATIQPPTQRGVSKNLGEWKSIEVLGTNAVIAFLKQNPSAKDVEIERMDIRPSKGIVKVLLNQGWWEVQVDGSTGEVLSIARRHSDWIEALHDGSIVSDLFKLISMNLLGFGLLILIMTGLWLWYGPRLIRKIKFRKSGRLV